MKELLSGSRKKGVNCSSESRKWGNVTTPESLETEGLYNRAGGSLSCTEIVEGHCSGVGVMGRKAGKSYGRAGRNKPLQSKEKSRFTLGRKKK